MRLVQVAERTSAVQVGVTNSPLDDKNGTGVSAVERGIDTWTVLRSLEDDEDLKRACDRVSASSQRFVHLPSGHRAGVYPGHRLLRVEGHPVRDGLGAPAELRVSRDELLAELEAEGFPVGEEAGFSRLDVTATVAFEDARAGLAFLQGVAHLEVARTGKRIAYTAKGGRVESVIWKSPNGRRTLARVYDKGVEANCAEPGELIRLEGQHRFNRAQRMSTEMISDNPHICEQMFAGRFAPLAAAAGGVKAASLPALIEHLRDKMRVGEIDSQKAVRALGFLAFGFENLPPRTRYRWQKEVRELGLVLADPMSDPIEVDVVEGIEAALAAWEAGSDGE